MDGDGRESHRGASHPTWKAALLVAAVLVLLVGLALLSTFGVW